MKIVLNTNVLVAGLLTPFGVCGEIVRMLTSGDITLCVDARILFEYDEVLRRPYFDIVPRKAEIVLEYIKNSAEICPTAPLLKSLPDPDDQSFLEVAHATKADCLITGNTKHFPPHAREGIAVLSPAQFLDYYKKYRIRASRRHPKGRT
jgi:uncharacterized protein